MVLVALVVLPHLLHEVLHLLRCEACLAHEYAFPEHCTACHGPAQHSTAQRGWLERTYKPQKECAMQDCETGLLLGGDGNGIGGLLCSGTGHNCQPPPLQLLPQPHAALLHRNSTTVTAGLWYCLL